MNMLDRIQRKLIKYKHSKRNVEVETDNEFAERLRKKINIINEEYQLGTSSWENYRKELRYHILNKNLNDFINWKVIQHTMFHEANKVEYKSIQNNPILMNAIKESKIGNPKPYYLNQQTSGNLIHHAYSVLQIIDKIDLINLNNVLEFGGGYGSMCRLFRNLGFQNNYFIFDLPEFSALQEFYLNNVNENYMKKTFLTGNMDELSMNPVENTLFLATWSFSEMPLDLREELLKHINFDYCLIAFQAEFDGINNIEYFDSFKERFKNLEFMIYPIEHLDKNFYLIGYKK